jgi:tRNA nucleotidyltransferase (CCA-adding enzyme)
MNHAIIFLKGLFPTACHDRIFLVGGSIRDMLLGKKNRDLDLVAALAPDEFIAAGFRLVEGRSTAPIWFRYDADFGKIEATPLAHVSGLAADLGGRDFTVNAIVMALGGEIIDPLAGRSDLEQRLLRACSPDAFLADPLRIFRGLRFEADGWRMSPDTEVLLRKQDWSPELTPIPVERFTCEILKAMELPKPERFFRRMLELGVGEIWLPELFRMPAIPAGPLIHHPEGDLFTHSLQVLGRVTGRTTDQLARFCALFHDIGKLATDPADFPKHHGHDEAGFNLARLFCDRLRLPAEYRTALSWTSRLHGTLNRWTELRGSTKVRLAEQALKAGISAILPLVCRADKGADGGITGWENAVRIARMSATDLGIDMERLEAMATGNRADLILQKRVEMLRRTYEGIS